MRPLLGPHHLDTCLSGGDAVRYAAFGQVFARDRLRIRHPSRQDWGGSYLAGRYGVERTNRLAPWETQSHLWAPHASPVSSYPAGLAARVSGPTTTLRFFVAAPLDMPGPRMKAPSTSTDSPGACSGQSAN
ncbi:hypothetical protein BO70DRAFT_104596 [Aspergillus heteromorphus CBS 117.55]|uniref:Uncharacterized protein n=1 Tax=Aspergillus heteromorphus CBS 117.55 TaxID=1448321 RepID=A0A317VJ17_9EURO|nr:uncharacterized protein BO70DRAFT_104596 [Aspergillus heteromorphus CBS 117.55]PWY74333.1 hypothetical protein BO70DRAFT_104596 [Aspergillus heteromorphus CBS 117.55]